MRRTGQSALHFSSPGRPFIPTPTRLLWDVFSHTSVTAQSIFTHISTMYLFIELSELGCGRGKKRPKLLKQQQRWFERELPRLRLQRFTAELPHSVQYSYRNKDGLACCAGKGWYTAILTGHPRLIITVLCKSVIVHWVINKCVISPQSGYNQSSLQPQYPFCN